MGDDLINQVIQMAFINQHVYSKVQFDNAKDTRMLHEAARENQEMMLVAAKSRLIPYVDELLERRLRGIIGESDGTLSLVIGNGEFTVVKIKEKPATPKQETQP